VIVHNAAHLFFGFTEAFTPEQVSDAYTNTVGALRVTPGGAAGHAPPGRRALAAKAAFDAFAESTACWGSQSEPDGCL
jgi:hypothetical protein